MANFSDTNVVPPVPDEARPSRKKPRAMRRVTLTSTAALISFVCYIGVFGGNVHTVAAGHVYRSSQLTGNGYEAVSARLIGNSLSHVVREYHIRTIINLRGGGPQDLRYRDELATSARMGVDHVDIPMSARHLPPPDMVNKLLDTFDRGRPPFLIHCQAGSDRTGLASALYAYLYEHEPLDQALTEELTWRYGHFSWSPTGAMDDFFEMYRSTGRNMDFRNWLKTKYPALYARSPERIIPAPG